MGSRARAAAAACVMVSGLLVGAAGTATAVADTGSVSGNEDTSDRHADKKRRAPRDSGATARASDASEPADRKSSDRNDLREPPRGGDSGSASDEAKTRSGRPTDGDGDGDGGDGEGGEEPRPPCCDGGTDCGPGWPSPNTPTGPPTSDGEYGEHRPETVPPGLPMPPMGGAGSSDVLDIVPGVGPNAATQAPINVPIIVARPVGIAPGVSPAGGGGPATGRAGAGSPAAPWQGAASSQSPSQSPSPRQPLPSAAGDGAAMPASAHRVGYAENLRGAGVPQLAALALPGLAGILLLTGAGGLLGYRQAKAGQHLGPSRIARFMN